MAERSLIGWLHKPCYIPWTLNIALGCFPGSQGCKFCYAPYSVVRQQHYPGRDGIVTKDTLGRLVWTGKVVPLPERLNEPRRKKKPHMIFVNALTDVFSPKLPRNFVRHLWQTMADTPQHIYVILTKQPKRMRDIVKLLAAEFGVLPNVWLGVSAENQHYAEVRIGFLMETPAAVRVVSCEPMLGPIDLTALKLRRQRPDLGWDVLGRRWGVRGAWSEPLSAGIDWVILGGESARRADARPMHIRSARHLVAQAVANCVAVFFKQWGSWAPAPWVVKLEDVGWDGTAEGKPAAAARAERIGATHYYSPNAHQLGWQIGVAGHKTWGGERRPLPAGDPNMPIRYHQGKSAGHLLDGVAWQQWPGPAGTIIDADREPELVVAR